MDATAETGTRGSLKSRSFLGLLATQFLGAMNDNMFRWLAVPVAKPVIGDAEALSLGLACFTVPYLLLASTAGYLADRFSKRTVIIACKVAEVVIMVLGATAILLGQLTLLFAVVALMGCQSALFSPAKFGSLPEMLHSNRLSSGNGWMGLVTVVSSAFGFIAGNWLYSLTAPDLTGATTLGQIAPAAAALLGVAVVGCGTSLFIARLPAADPDRALPPNPVSDTWHNFRRLGSHTPLLRTALGIAFFWMLASLAQMNIDTFGIHELALKQKDIGLLLGILVVGLGAGSVLAGIWSGGKVELGIVPLGAVGIAVSAGLLYMTGEQAGDGPTLVEAYYWSSAWLFLLGVCAGLFDIPLEAFLQHRSPVQYRGTILAASNFLAFSFILVAAGVFYAMREGLGLSASEIFLVAGLGTLPVAIYVFSLLPNATIRFVVWLASQTVYRVRVYGRETLPERGGALLVANHVSWVDGILLLITSSRPIRMIAYSDYVARGFVGWLARTFGVIPIEAGRGAKSVLRSLKTAREAIINGDLVCIFAEGGLTRTGQLQPFQRGMMRIVEGSGAPVVPVYLDGLWGSVFSYRGGRFFWKWPRKWPYPVSIAFGKPLDDADDVNKVRQAVETLGVKLVDKRISHTKILPRQFLRRCREALFRMKVADSSGAELTGGKLLTATLVFRRLLERHPIPAEEKTLGLLLPPSVGGVIANSTATLMGKVVVNLNYTLSQEDLNYCVAESGINYVLTSRKFLERKPVEVDAELIYLEDLKEKSTALDKLVASTQAYLLPAVVLERLHGLTNISPDDLLTIIFTSGSTGKPKGVMLSHKNILSNTQGVDELFQLDKSDMVLGVLPFFHSFGYTGVLWLVLSLEISGVYHYNPLDARTAGKLSEKYGVSILLATPTFLRSYVKRCTPEQMKRLDLVIVGAEKMPVELAESFKKTFDVEPSEGYGCTELSPVAAVNVPPSRAGSSSQTTTKLGTVGRTFPGVVAKVVDPESGEDMGVNTEGLLLIKGPNVMKGYLNQPEKTAEAIRDGWYDTGDLARIDDEGFIQITGRQSRFAKIGGEMVPHGRIEELLFEVLGGGEVEEADGEPPSPLLAVTSVPDEKKGEKLVVVHRPLEKSPEQIVKELSEFNIPNLWVPEVENFIEVEEVPVLGTGKLDLKTLNTLARERCGQTA